MPNIGRIDKAHVHASAEYGLPNNSIVTVPANGMNGIHKTKPKKLLMLLT